MMYKASLKEDIFGAFLLILTVFHSTPFFPGYVGSKSFLEEVLQVVHQLRQANPKLVFGMYSNALCTVV